MYLILKDSRTISSQINRILIIPAFLYHMSQSYLISYGTILNFFVDDNSLQKPFYALETKISYHLGKRKTGNQLFMQFIDLGTSELGSKGENEDGSIPALRMIEKGLLPPRMSIKWT